MDSKGVWNLEGGYWIRGRVEDERECGGIERGRVVAYRVGGGRAGRSFGEREG